MVNLISKEFDNLIFQKFTFVGVEFFSIQNFFCLCTTLICFFTEAVKYHSKEITIEDVEKLMKDWLIFAPDRNGGHKSRQKCNEAM